MEDPTLPSFGYLDESIASRQFLGNGRGLMADSSRVAPAAEAADDRRRRKPAPVRDAIQVPVPERDPAAFAPVFVLAPARSHSSVVTTAIGQHPELHAFPELGLYRRATIGPILFDPPGWKGIPSAARRGGLLRALAHHNYGDQGHDAVLEAYHWLRCRRAWSGAHVYDYLLASVAPKIGVEKTPDNSNNDASLARLAVAYPRGRFLHLTRHPLTTQLSMHDAWSRLSFWEVPPKLFHQFCMAAWLFHHERILRFTSSLTPEQTIRVRAEDILNHPRREMAAICRWLEIDSGSEAVTAMCHPERSPFASVGSQDAPYGNDPKFLRSPKMRRVEIPPSLDIPGDWVVDPWLLTATVELAHRLGYDHVDP
jgi:hypothetical protein